MNALLLVALLNFAPETQSIARSNHQLVNPQSVNHQPVYNQSGSASYTPPDLGIPNRRRGAGTR